MFALLLAGAAGAAGSLLSYERNPARIALSAVLALTMGLLALFWTQSLPWGDALLFGGAAAWAVSDAMTGFIRDRLTIPLLMAVTLANVSSNGPLMLAGGLALGAALSVLNEISGIRWLGGNGHRWLGDGDVMAGTCIGAALGATGLVLSFAVAGLLEYLAFGLFWALRVPSENPSAPIYGRLGLFLVPGVLIAASLLNYQVAMLGSR